MTVSQLIEALKPFDGNLPIECDGGVPEAVHLVGTNLDVVYPEGVFANFPYVKLVTGMIE